MDLSLEELGLEIPAIKEDCEGMLKGGFNVLVPGEVKSPMEFNLFCPVTNSCPNKCGDSSNSSCSSTTTAAPSSISNSMSLYF
jgi:hypothetical protein